MVGIDEQPVDVPRLQAGVLERQRDRLAREVGGRPAVDLPHLGDAKTGNRGGRAHGLTIQSV
jgi:hypothetical protein